LTVPPASGEAAGAEPPPYNNPVCAGYAWLDCFGRIRVWGRADHCPRNDAQHGKRL